MSYPTYLVHFNKNHDKLGRFTYGDGNGDRITADSYRTPELDKKYDELKKTGVLKIYEWKNNKSVMPKLKPEDDAEKEWGKDLVKAIDIGMKAYGVDKMPNLKDKDINYRRTWFFSGGDKGETFGFLGISYLIAKGWSGDKVFNALRDAEKMWDKTTEFRDDYTGYPNEGWVKKSIGLAEKYPYKGVYPLSSLSKRITDEEDSNDSIDTYIGYCEELSKEMEHSDMSYPTYLVHFNRNHDKNGRFTYGDGDGKANTKSSDRYKKTTGLHRVTYNTNGNNKFRGSESVANAKFTAGKINRTGFGESLAGNSRGSRFTRYHEGTQTTTARNLSKNARRNSGEESKPYGGSGGGGGSSSAESGGTMMIDKDLVEAGEEFVEDLKKRANNIAISKGMTKLMASTGRNANERTNSSSYRSTDSSRGSKKYENVQEHRNVAPEQYLYKKK